MAGGGGDVIDGGPLNGQQVETQHDHRGDRQPLQDQNFHNIGLLINDGAPGAGDDHQPVADEEAAHAGENGGPAGVSQPGPVRRLGGAAGEGPEDHGDGRRPGHGVARGNMGHRLPAAGVVQRQIHGDHQQHKHQWHRQARQRVQSLVAHQRGDAEQNAKQHHQRLGQRLGQGEDLHQRDSDRGGPPGVPAQLGKTKNKIGQLAADLPEAEPAHQHRIQAAARGDPAQRRGIEGQQGVADDGYPQQIDDGKGDAEFAAGKHRAGEKGKAEQHHGDGKYAFASGGGRFDEGKIIAV